MVWLRDGEKISKISLFVLAQLTNVTDTQTHTHRQTDTRTPNAGIYRAYAYASRGNNHELRRTTGETCLNSRATVGPKWIWAM